MLTSWVHPSSSPANFLKQVKADAKALLFCQSLWLGFDQTFGTESAEEFLQPRDCLTDFEFFMVCLRVYAAGKSRAVR